MTNEQTAFDSIEAQVTALQSALVPLTSSQNSVFQASTATSSNTNILNAAASGNAAAGVYNLTVNSLATAGAIASQGFDSSTSQVSQGTLTLNIGNTSTAITVDSSNDTLQGVATRSTTQGQRSRPALSATAPAPDSKVTGLMLTSTATGTANAVSATFTPSGSGGGTQPIFNAGTISNAIPASSFSGSSAVTSNAGAGYTGSSNDVYTFTVQQGGTVGTDDGIQLAYTNASGKITGTITVNSGDANTLISVPNANGVQVEFADGTLNQGDSFSVKTFAPTVQAASNASVTLGSGSGAMTVSSSSNTLNSLIPGVTLSLDSAAPSTPVSVTVGSDTTSITNDINAFVTAYNNVISSIQQQTSYNATTGQAGMLLGNVQTQNIENQIRSLVGNVVPGANPLLNNLGAIGITTGSNGQLSAGQHGAGQRPIGRRAGRDGQRRRQAVRADRQHDEPGRAVRHRQQSNAIFRRHAVHAEHYAGRSAGFVDGDKFSGGQHGHRQRQQHLHRERERPDLRLVDVGVGNLHADGVGPGRGVGH